MLCDFTRVVPLSNNEAWSVINNVTARREKQNNYFFNIRVLIMIQKSMCIREGLVLCSPWITDSRMAFPHFPMNIRPRD